MDQPEQSTAPPDLTAKCAELEAQLTQSASQIDELENQLVEMAHQLNLKDNEVAQLRAKVAEYESAKREMAQVTETFAEVTASKKPLSSLSKGRPSRRSSSIKSETPSPAPDRKVSPLVSETPAEIEEEQPVAKKSPAMLRAGGGVSMMAGFDPSTIKLRRSSIVEATNIPPSDEDKFKTFSKSEMKEFNKLPAVSAIKPLSALKSSMGSMDKIGSVAESAAEDKPKPLLKSASVIMPASVLAAKTTNGGSKWGANKTVSAPAIDAESSIDSKPASKFGGKIGSTTSDTESKPASKFGAANVTESKPVCKFGVKAPAVDTATPEPTTIKFGSKVTSPEPKPDTVETKPISKFGAKVTSPTDANSTKLGATKTSNSALDEKDDKPAVSKFGAKTVDTAPKPSIAVSDKPAGKFGVKINDSQKAASPMPIKSGAPSPAAVSAPTIPSSGGSLSKPEQEIISWMQSVISDPITAGTDVKSTLRDGQALCKLANKLRKDSAQIKVSMGKFQQSHMENINAYLKVTAEQFKITSANAFTPADLYDGAGMDKVLKHLQLVKKQFS